MCSRVVAKPSFSRHEEAWEKQKMVPVGTFRRFATVEGGAIQKVLDGEIGTTEGGARMMQELMDEDVVGCETLTPIDLTGQIRRILEAGHVNAEIQDVIKCLRFDGMQTGLLCHQWPNPGKSISTPEQIRAKQDLQRHFNAIVESKDEKMGRLDPKFYRLAAARTGVEPHKLIYVDSRAQHLEPAKAIRLAVVYSLKPESTVQELEELLQVPLRGFSWSEVSAEVNKAPSLSYT